MDGYFDKSSGGYARHDTHPSSQQMITISKLCCGHLLTQLQSWKSYCLTGASIRTHACGFGTLLDKAMLVSDISTLDHVHKKLLCCCGHCTLMASSPWVDQPKLAAPQPQPVHVSPVLLFGHVRWILDI